MAGPAPPGDHPDAPQMARFIVDKNAVLSPAAMRNILHCVLTNLGDNPPPPGEDLPPIVSDSEPGTYIDLDRLAVAAPQALVHIYRLVQAHVAALARPATGAP